MYSDLLAKKNLSYAVAHLSVVIQPNIWSSLLSSYIWTAATALGKGSCLQSLLASVTYVQSCPDPFLKHSSLSQEPFLQTCPDSQHSVGILYQETTNQQSSNITSSNISTCCCIPASRLLIPRSIVCLRPFLSLMCSFSPFFSSQYLLFSSFER